MSDFDAIADAYIDMWNETDTTARKARIEQLFTPAGRYTDPLADVTGHEQIDAMINAVQQQFPGMRFTLVGPVDAHHRQARFGWALGPSGAESLIDGFDVLERDDDGRLTLVLGFLDKVPSA
ncbi:nuclear transport factor 2 family protein [Rhodococcus sp. NPDC059969]|uniref:nuclear transport factor 2 family protein n=1 Tax=unclassified Rhodococcus (in: high G+C Gram-positive bacteria) TaxID=192944 RepID=UPI0036291CF0